MTYDLGLVITIVGVGIAFIAAMIALFIWLRTESNADRRDMMNLLKEMHNEMIDFHSRLLILEERYIKIREKK